MTLEGLFKNAQVTMECSSTPGLGGEVMKVADRRKTTLEIEVFGDITEFVEEASRNGGKVILRSAGPFDALISRWNEDEEKFRLAKFEQEYPLIDAHMPESKPILEPRRSDIPATPSDW